MPDPAFMCDCDVCGNKFQFGEHVYDGKRIHLYDIMVCMGCYRSNWDGWAPQFEGNVTAKLVAQGKRLPARNDKGLLPRD